MDELNASMIERISRNEEASKSHERRIQILEEKNESLVRMSVLLDKMEENNKKRDEYQKERDEQQNQQMREFSDTMKQVNVNLTELNNGHRDLNQRVGNIEEDSKQRWDWNRFFRQAVPAILIALAIAALSYWFGIK
ncbi:hypothetical protein ABEY43_06330 [Priestia megaterium]